MFEKILAFFKPVNKGTLLTNALAELLKDSPDMRNLWERIHRDGYTVEILDGYLLGDTEASSEIRSDGATITVDVFKVTTVLHDRLEPVLGHELFHVQDARFTYGIGRFIEMVNDERGLSWDQRTAEKSAIVQENRLREELAKCPGFGGMPQTRAAQNKRAKNK